MKILIACGIFPPDIGGPATYVAGIASALAASGHDMRVVTCGHDAPGSAEFPFPVRRISRTWPLPVRMFFFFVSCLRQPADLIFAQDAFSSGFPAACAAFAKRVPLVTKVVGDFSWEHACRAYGARESVAEFQVAHHPLSVRIIRAVQRFVCGRSRIVIVPARHLRFLPAAWGVPAADICVVRNAPYSFSGSAPLPRMPERDLVFAAGRLVPRKGFEALIRAARTASVRLAIAGDGPLRGDLERRAGDDARSGKVVFLGAIGHARMAELHARAGRFVSYSDHEGSPHAVLEAHAANVPLVLSDIPAHREFVGLGMPARLVRLDNEGDLRQAMTEPLPDLPARAPSEIFSWERMISELAAVLGRVAHRPPPDPDF